MIVYLLMLAVLSLVAQGQEYHYQRPHIPFNVETSQQRQQQPTKYVVQTLGPNSRTYDLESHRSPAVYENHQTNIVALQQQQQQQIAYQSVPQQQQQQHHQQGQIAYSQPQQLVQQQQVQQHYVQQQQQQQVHQQQQYQQQLVYQAPQQQLQVAPQQQLHTTAYTNPLLLNVNYQQQTPALIPPPAPASPPQPISYYTQPQQVVSHQPQSQYVAPPPPQSQPQPQPQPQPQQVQQPQRVYFQNPQPYAVVTLPNGQQVQDGGHGSGVAPPNVQYQLIASTGTQPHPPRLGDHIGQSQSSTLDGYKYKQAIPGDTREYQRYVNNCDASGQCQQSNLGPGQVEPNHQQVVQTARASTQPRIEGCTKSAVVYVPVGAQQNQQGQLRPKSRRAVVHTEQLFIRYPYN